MSKRVRPSSTQTEFLRKLRNDPMGLPPDEWPSALVLRRWIRQPGFCSAINGLRSALFVRTDMHLVAAAQALHRSLSSCNGPASPPAGAADAPLEPSASP